MNRKTVLLAFGIAVLLLGSTATALIVLVRHEPDFYRRAYVPPGLHRQNLAATFNNQYLRFAANVINEERKWDAEFTEEQINSYFEEDFARSGNAEKNLPDGVREPRLAIDANKVRFGFRYGEGIWSTVVSIDLNVWLPAKEPNLVAVQLEGFRAGALPIAAQSILDRFSESLRRQDIEITWYRNEGKPVALLRFQPGRKATTVLLRNLKLEPGRLRIGVGAGGSVPSEGPPGRAMLPETIKPVAN